jgi:hypothetical protein
MFKFDVKKKKIRFHGYGLHQKKKKNERSKVRINSCFPRDEN